MYYRRHGYIGGKSGDPTAGLWLVSGLPLMDSLYTFRLHCLAERRLGWKEVSSKTLIPECPASVLHRAPRAPPPFEIPKRVFKRDPPKTFAPAALAVAAAPPPFPQILDPPLNIIMSSFICELHLHHFVDSGNTLMKKARI